MLRARATSTIQRGTLALVAFAAAALLSGRAEAQRSAASPATAASRSFLHRVLLDRAPVIVRGRFDKDESLTGIGLQVTTFKTIRKLRGEVPEQVLVAGMGERARAFPDLDKILFLRPMRSGRLHELVDLIDLLPQDEEVVPATLVAYFGLDRETNPVILARELHAISLRNIESTSLFGVRTAIRELDGLVDSAPHLFTTAAVERIERAKARIPADDLESYRALKARVARVVARHFAGVEAQLEDAEDRESMRRAVAAWRTSSNPEERLLLLDRLVPRFGRKLRLFAEAAIEDGDPGVRARAAYWLGEFAEGASFAALVDALDTAGEAERRARIEALGKLGRQEAVRRLAAHAETRPLVDAVALALARIGGTEALDLLDRIELRLKPEGEDAVTVEAIRHLRSPEFVREEARRRAEAASRY